MTSERLEREFQMTDVRSSGDQSLVTRRRGVSTPRSCAMNGKRRGGCYFSDLDSLQVVEFPGFPDGE